MAARELTCLPDWKSDSASSLCTVSRNPYSLGSRRGGIVGYMMKVVKAMKLVSVIVRRTAAKVECDGAT